MVKKTDTSRLKAKINKFYLENLFPNYYKAYNRELDERGTLSVDKHDAKDIQYRSELKAWLNPSADDPNKVTWVFYIDPKEVHNENPYIKRIAQYEHMDQVPLEDLTLLCTDPNKEMREKAEAVMKKVAAKKAKKSKSNLRSIGP